MMIGHLPFPVYAVMVAGAFFGIIRRGSPTPAIKPPTTLKLSLAIGLIFLARFAVSAWFDPGRDGDIAWQQWLGQHILQTGSIPLSLGPEAFTAPHAPWVPQEWALSLAVALTLGTWRFALLVAITTFAGVATLFISAKSALRLGASTLAIAIAVSCVAFAMLESYGIRAQVFSWPMLAAIMFCLRSSEKRVQWWIPAIVVVWANLHASALLAPVLIALWTFGVAIQERGCNVRVFHYALLTFSSAVAVFLTPLAYQLPLYAIGLFHSPIRTQINEWQPASIMEPSFAMGALPLIVAACILGFDRSRRWPEILVFGAVTWLAFSAARNVPICAIVLAPAVAQRLTAYLPERQRVKELLSERAVTALLFAGSTVAAIATVFALASSHEYQNGTLPVRALAALHSIAGEHNLYCEDFAWCSLALQYPNVREFIDGRCDPFPLSVWKDYQTVYGLKRGWGDVLNRRNVDAVVVDKKHALAHALPRTHNWRLVYADTTFRLFLRERALAVTKR